MSELPKINLPEKEEAGIEEDRQLVRDSKLLKKIPRIVYGYAATRMAANRNRVTAAMRNRISGRDMLLFEYFGIQKPNENDARALDKATRIGMSKGKEFRKAAYKEGLYLCAEMCGACTVKDCVYFERSPKKLWEQLIEHDFTNKTGNAESERTSKNEANAAQRNKLWNYFRNVIRGKESNNSKSCGEVYFGDVLPESEPELPVVTEESMVVSGHNSKKRLFHLKNMGYAIGMRNGSTPVRSEIGKKSRTEVEADEQKYHSIALEEYKMACANCAIQCPMRYTEGNDWQTNKTFDSSEDLLEVINRDNNRATLLNRVRKGSRKDYELLLENGEISCDRLMSSKRISQEERDQYHKALLTDNKE
jgi:hypothetical protein